MPRIQEYGAPEIQADSPLLDISSRPIEEAGAAGRAVEQFGNQFNQLGAMHYEQAVKEEQENAQQVGAMSRAQSRANLESQIRDGSVNVTKTMEDYTSQVDEQSDNFQTKEGRRAFNRQATINRAMLFRTASNAEAHLSGERAKAKLQSSLDLDSSTLVGDPSTFPEVYHANMDAIDEQVNSGNVPAAISEKLKHEYGKELAKSAVRGWAQMNPDVAEKMLNGTPETNGKGAWDEFFDGDTKAQMQGYVQQQKRAVEVDAERQDRLEKKAQEKRADVWRVQNFSRLENNELSAKEVTKAVEGGILSPQEGEHQLSMIDKNVREASKTDHTLLNDLTSRIYLPDDDPRKINSSRQIDEFAAQGRLTILDRNRLVKAIDNTDEGKNLKSNKKVLIDYMKSNLVKSDKMLGLSDPEGERNFADAFQSLQYMEDQYRKEGKPVSSLYDPYSKDSFYQQALTFKRSSRDIMKANIDRMKAQSGARQAVDGADKAKVVLPRTTDSGEKLSPDEWMKRRKGTK